jgi:diguanylate cyclase (GGDEF)-like protein/PAS domain S-box-containing protein
VARWTLFVAGVDGPSCTLKDTDQSFRLLVEEMSEGALTMTAQGVMVYANRRLAGMLKTPLEKVIGSTVRTWIAPASQPVLQSLLAKGAAKERRGELFLVASDGTMMPVYLSVSNLPIEGRPDAYCLVAVDLTERKRIEDQVHQMAFHDLLTNLPNRRLLNDRVSQAMSASNRSGCFGALMFLDLDNFKSLNDSHGHEAGDLLLIQVATRLKRCIREMDTVARFGGDEFVVMISELSADGSSSAERADIIAEKIRAALAKPYVLTVPHEGGAATTVEHHCTTSIGVALFNKHDASQENIFKWADAAMYQAKKAGGDSIRFHASQA